MVFNITVNHKTSINAQKNRKSKLKLDTKSNL